MSILERTLGEVLQPASAAVSVDPEGEYPIAGIYSFGRGLIRRPTIRGSETSYTTLSRLRANQLTMSKLNAWEGALAVVPEEFDSFYVSPEYPVFSIDSTQADPTYIAHLVTWPGLWERLTPRGSMVRRKRTNPGTLLATRAPLPDLDEQRRIAARLDAMIGKHARVRELHARRTDLQLAFKESAVNDAIGGAQESFPIKGLISLARRQVFPEPGRTYREIGIKSFGRGIFHKAPVTSADISEKRVFAIQPGDLVFSNVFAWEGAVALAGYEESGMIGSHRFMTYVTDGSVADARYLRHYFTSAQGLDVIRRASPGSAGRNKTLGIKSFEQQIIPVPDIETQQRIGEALDHVDSSLMTDDLELLDALKFSLLNAAFRGRL
jgi:type I restriction enzyme S subunit